MPGAAGQLKKLYQQLIGGTSPGATGNLTGDLSEQIQALIDRLLSTTDLGSFTASATGSLGEQLAYLQSLGVLSPAGSPVLGKRLLVPCLDMLALAAVVTTAPPAWIAANAAIYVPFRLPTPLTLTKIHCPQGVNTSASKYIDVGIYDINGNRLVSAGSTLWVGNSVMTFDVADTALDAGDYYLAVAFSYSSANYGPIAYSSMRFDVQPTSDRWTPFGVRQQSSALPLPATATFATPTTTTIPVAVLEFA